MIEVYKSDNQAIDFTHEQLRGQGIHDVMTPQQAGEFIRYMYHRGPGFAAYYLPEHYFNPAPGQRGFLGDVFSGFGDIVTSTLGSVSGIVGSLGTNAQANAANAQAIAANNAAVAQQQAQQQAQQMQKQEKQKNYLLYGGAAVAVIIIAYLFTR